MTDSNKGGWECKYLGDHTHLVMIRWSESWFLPMAFARWRLDLGVRARMTSEGYECMVSDEELLELKRIVESQPLRMFSDEREKDH
jgi:hypothetical protein